MLISVIGSRHKSGLVIDHSCMRTFSQNVAVFGFSKVACWKVLWPTEDVTTVCLSTDLAERMRDVSSYLLSRWPVTGCLDEIMPSVPVWATSDEL